MENPKKVHHFTKSEVEMLIEAIQKGQVTRDDLSQEEVDPLNILNERKELTPEKLREFYDYHGYPAMVYLMEDLMTKPG